MSKQKDVIWSQYALRLIVSTASHPLEYAKFLIQIGHEPIAPQSTKTLFGKPALKLPNIFEYVKYIKSVDGFVGCYRGLAPKVCGHIASSVAMQKILRCTDLDKEDNPEDLAELTEAKKRELMIRSLKKDLLSRVTAIIVSHPFHVITIRMMAQFVGGESKYIGVFGSAAEVYRKNGLIGFFNGLVPRVLGDVISIILATALSYVVNTYIIEEKEPQMYISATMSFIAAAVTYPFQVVSNCMAVSGSGLIAGGPPYMPSYSSWIECWSDLSHRNQLKRGSSLLIRYYVGPQVVLGGRAVAITKDEVLKYNY